MLLLFSGMSKSLQIFALAFFSVMATVVEGTGKPMPALTQAAVGRVCAKLISTLPTLPVGEAALRAYVSASDVGRGKFMYRLAMMKGKIDGKERYVFFLGENHMSGLQSYWAANKVMNEFDVLAVEDIADAAKKSESRTVRWFMTVAEFATWPMIQLTSAFSRGHAKTSDPKKIVIKLEAAHIHSDKMNDDLKSDLRIGVAGAVYSSSILGPLYWMFRVFPQISVDSSIAILEPSMPEAILGAINLASGTYIVVKLGRLNAETEKARKDPAAKSLGQHSYAMRQGDNHDVIVVRDTVMTAELIKEFRANPDMDYALVMVGKGHIPGMMKLLRREHEFDRIPLNLKNESRQGD